MDDSVDVGVVKLLVFVDVKLLVFVDVSENGWAGITGLGK